MSKLMLNFRAQLNTHTLMKLNTVIQLHLAKKGNHAHTCTKQPSQNLLHMAVSDGRHKAQYTHTKLHPHKVHKFYVLAIDLLGDDL